MSISGNLIGSYSQIGKTFVIQDEEGNEVMAVITGQEQIFTATDNDVREGMVYASDEGVRIGSKNIPAYRTTAGSHMIAPGDNFSIPLSDYKQYDYTVFQCMVSAVNFDDLENSVNTSIVSFNNGVFEVNSVDKIAAVTRNLEAQSIDLNIFNDSENYYWIHYFTYRKED